MFAGPLPEGMPVLLEHGLTPTVHDWTIARAVSAAAKEPTGVYVKVDCGFGRLGTRLSDAREFIQQVCDLDNVVVDGVYTNQISLSTLRRPLPLSGHSQLSTHS